MLACATLTLLDTAKAGNVNAARPPPRRLDQAAETKPSMTFGRATIEVKQAAALKERLNVASVRLDKPSQRFVSFAQRPWPDDNRDVGRCQR